MPDIEFLKKALAAEQDYQLSLYRNPEDSDAYDEVLHKTMVRISRLSSKINEEMKNDKNIEGR